MLFTGDKLQRREEIETGIFPVVGSEGDNDFEVNRTN
jgi:hypothetical protein